jgi:hypothetical protein
MLMKRLSESPTGLHAGTFFMTLGSPGTLLPVELVLFVVGEFAVTRLDQVDIVPVENIVDARFPPAYYPTAAFEGDDVGVAHVPQGFRETAMKSGEVMMPQTWLSALSGTVVQFGEMTVEPPFCSPRAKMSLAVRDPSAVSCGRASV